MAMVKRALRTMPGSARLAHAAMRPTLGANDTIMLDHGANADGDANILIHKEHGKKAHDTAEPRHKQIGLDVNRFKSTFWVQNSDAIIHQGIQTTTKPAAPTTEILSPTLPQEHQFQQKNLSPT